MFQLLPEWDHYAQIERDLLNKKQKAYLTLEELEAEKQDENFYKAGMKTYTEYKLNQAEADALNRFTIELNRTRPVHLREYFKDRRHQQFCMCAEEISPDQLAKMEYARFTRKAKKAA